MKFKYAATVLLAASSSGTASASDVSRILLYILLPMCDAYNPPLLCTLLPHCRVPHSNLAPAGLNGLQTSSQKIMFLLQAPIPAFSIMANSAYCQGNPMVLLTVFVRRRLMILANYLVGIRHQDWVRRESLRSRLAGASSRSKIAVLRLAILLHLQIRVR
jgi:hypothetical protein